MGKGVGQITASGEGHEGVRSFFIAKKEGEIQNEIVKYLVKKTTDTGIFLVEEWRLHEPRW